MRKTSIPTIFDQSSIFCEIPGGAILRRADGEEHVHGRWCLLEQNIGKEKTAFAVINKGHGPSFFRYSLNKLSMSSSVISANGEPCAWL